MLQGTEDALVAKLHETVAALELAAAVVLESKRPKVEIKEEVEGALVRGEGVQDLVQIRREICGWFFCERSWCFIARSVVSLNM